jgi:hypothetical protein
MACEIPTPEQLQVVRRIERRGALETAHRPPGNCGQVFRYSVAKGRAARDPSADLRGALPRPRANLPKDAVDILEGFEGDGEAEGHRETVGDWCKHGLP